MGAHCTLHQHPMECVAAFPRIHRKSSDIRKYYRIGRVLGSGSFGQVREATHRISGETFAVKVMERQTGFKEKSIPGRPTNEAMMISEMQILSQLCHKNIVQLIGFYQDRYFFYTVMELCQGGELFHQIVKRRQFTEQDAANLSGQIVSALAYIHSQGIVHRDIKAENFLFKDRNPNAKIMLIDFGMSAKLPECGYLSDLCGSPHYISPELINKKYNQGADMWAFGVMIYLMLFGKYPFEGNKASAIAREVRTKQLNWTKEECPNLTDSAIDFLSRLLDRNQATRLTAEQALKHPWISDTNAAKESVVIGKDKLELARRLSHGYDRTEAGTTRRDSKLSHGDKDYAELATLRQSPVCL